MLLCILMRDMDITTVQYVLYANYASFATWSEEDTVSLSLWTELSQESRVTVTISEYLVSYGVMIISNEDFCGMKNMRTIKLFVEGELDAEGNVTASQVVILDISVA